MSENGRLLAVFVEKWPRDDLSVTGTGRWSFFVSSLSDYDAWGAAYSFCLGLRRVKRVASHGLSCWTFDNSR